MSGEAPGPEAPVPAARRSVLYLAAWAAAALPAYGMVTLLWVYAGAFQPFGIAALGAYALGFPVVVRRLGVPKGPEFVTFLLLAGLAVGALSIVTGGGNGLTDEAFTTPRFAGFLLAGHNPYTTPMTIHYDSYGRHLTSTSVYVYLPVLMFLQVPGVAYKWTTLGCWAACVLLARRRFDTAILLGQPYLMVVGANGYNDLPVLLLLTVAFVGLAGRRQRWAEVLALGCKQFANVIVLGYYLLRRDWRRFGAALAVTVAFVLPFALWGGTSVLCPTLVANRLPSCPRTGGIQLLINYPVWLVWVVAVFYAATVRDLRAWPARHPRAPGAVRRTAELLARPGLAARVVTAFGAAFSGLATFLVVASALPGPTLGEFAGGVVGAGALAAWYAVWAGPRPGAAGGTAGVGGPPLRYVLGATVAVAAIGGALVAGFAPVTAAAVGLFPGAAFLVTADLVAPRAAGSLPMI